MFRRELLIAGVLSVVSVGSAPPTLNYSQSGNMLTFSWSDTAFKLQAQTNAISSGFSTNWSDYPDTSNPVNVLIDRNKGAVFFRLFQ